MTAFPFFAWPVPLNYFVNTEEMRPSEAKEEPVDPGFLSACSWRASLLPTSVSFNHNWREDETKCPEASSASSFQVQSLTLFLIKTYMFIKGKETRKTMIILNKNSESNTTLFHYNLLKQVLWADLLYLTALDPAGAPIRKNVPSYSECVRLGSVVSVVGDQGRTAVLCDPPGQLLNDDSALCTHLHVTPTLICLTHTNTNLNLNHRHRKSKQFQTGDGASYSSPEE